MPIWSFYFWRRRCLSFKRKHYFKIFTSQISKLWSVLMFIILEMPQAQIQTQSIFIATGTKIADVITSFSKKMILMSLDTFVAVTWRRRMFFDENCFHFENLITKTLFQSQKSTYSSNDWKWFNVKFTFLQGNKCQEMVIQILWFWNILQGRKCQTLTFFGL